MDDTSRSVLQECHPKLRQWAYSLDAMLPVQFREGHRGEREQNRLFDEGKTKVRWPDSKHNRQPSEAVHVFLNEIQWEDERPFYVLYGAGLMLAKSQGIWLRWGGDWDRDLDFGDQSFMDLAHWELLT